MITHAIIIPYRDRKKHLDTMLQHLSKYSCDIYIFEQNNNNLFNRGQLFNSILNVDKQYDYLIFHDVDLIPDPSINYMIPYNVPTHLSCFCEQFDYKVLDNIPYKESQMFGGVIAMSQSWFKSISGFNSLYEGWGYEDNDMVRKLSHIDRKPWRYQSLQHDHLDIVNQNLMNNMNVYNSKETLLRKDDMIKVYEKDNIKHYMVDVKVREHNCAVLYYDSMSKLDIDMCLLNAHKDKKNVIVCEQGMAMDQSSLNYFANYKKSCKICKNVYFIHNNNLLKYILDRKIPKKQFHLIKKTFTKYDYENHKFIEKTIYNPMPTRNTKHFNSYLYKLLHSDLPYTHPDMLYKHYIEQGVNEDRNTSYNILDFDLFMYYEFNKDLHHIDIFTEPNVILNHYIIQGINENRITYKNTPYKMSNVEWSNNVSTYDVKNYLLKPEIVNLSHFTFPDLPITGIDRTLIITHPGGGGVEKYLIMLQKFYPNNLVIKPNSVKMELYEIENNYFTDVIEIYKHICQFNIVRIICNHLCIYTNQMLQMFDHVRLRYKCKMVSLLHDLTYKIKHEENAINLIKKSDLVLSPSKYIQKVYKVQSMYLPHPDMKNVIIRSKAGMSKKVLVMGSNKGESEMLKYLVNNEIIFIGNTKIKHKNLLNLGPYKENSVLNTIKEINPDLIWFPSKYPEAYCYALSSAMMSGYPICAYDIGANSERLKSWPCATLLSVNETFNNIMLKEYSGVTNETFVSEEDYFNIINLT